MDELAVQFEQILIDGSCRSAAIRASRRLPGGIFAFPDGTLPRSPNMPSDASIIVICAMIWSIPSVK